VTTIASCTPERLTMLPTRVSNYSSMVLVGTRWHFLTGSLASARRWRDLGRYLRSFWVNNSAMEILGELLSVTIGRTGASVASQLYMSVAWNDAGAYAGIPSNLIPQKWQLALNEDRSEWMATRLHEVLQHHDPWWQTFLRHHYEDYFHDGYWRGSPVREISPFMDPLYVGYVCSLPAECRFVADSPYPYQWYKALQLSLLPQEVRGALPTYKQGYGHIFREYMYRRHHTVYPWTLELGLLRTRNFEDLEAYHPRLPAVVHNTERWIDGAIAMGATPESV
jgi:hypothetical protein